MSGFLSGNLLHVGVACTRAGTGRQFQLSLADWLDFDAWYLCRSETIVAQFAPILLVPARHRDPPRIALPISVL